jgi:hypothetical protein
MTGAALVLDGFEGKVDLAVMRAVLAWTPLPAMAARDKGAMCTT